MAGYTGAHFAEVIARGLVVETEGTARSTGAPSRLVQCRGRGFKSGQHAIGTPPPCIGYATFVRWKIRLKGG